MNESLVLVAMVAAYVMVGLLLVGYALGTGASSFLPKQKLAMAKIRSARRPRG